LDTPSCILILVFSKAEGWKPFLKWLITNLQNVFFSLLVPMAAQSKARTAFDCSNTGIIGSNPARGMDVCLRFLCVVLIPRPGSPTKMSRWFIVIGNIQLRQLIQRLLKTINGVECALLTAGCPHV
jgi:hypothetical protein